MAYARYVDPFLGNGAMDLPQPRGLAASWFFVKAQTGNTHPGACLPFGMISACPYSGAYVSGYGVNAPNSHARPPQAFSELSASGFTHFQPSGTGAVEVYGNYLRVTPQSRTLRRPGERWLLVDERAHPGYYTTRLGDAGVRAELTVTARTACHRYTFPSSAPAHLVIDFGCGGLAFPDRRSRPTAASVEVLDQRTIQGRVVMEGIPLHVVVRVDTEPETCRLFVAGQMDKEDRCLGPEASLLEHDEPFGATFSFAHGGSICVHLGFSLRSLEQARQNLEITAAQSFDQQATAARETWNEALARVTVEGGSEERLRMFTTALYHSLIKPADCTGESPFWAHDGAYFVDFATMWDQYKTQLPLLLSAYPERGTQVVNALLNLAEHVGFFPIGVLLSDNFQRFEDQARGLAWHTLADAHYRDLDGIDWARALRLIATDLRRPRHRDFREQGITPRPPHTLDLADACACTARLARSLGDAGPGDAGPLDAERAAEFAALAGHWRHVYDPDTGLLRPGQYYEGGLWNYSFRLLHDMAARVALFPTEDAFIETLDRFFGYGQPPVTQAVDPGDVERMRRGLELNRFEGLNNEPDIEAPYAYLYAGRPDRTAEVIRAAMRFMFTTGRGGLPGNDDSGGLSSWYVWNAVGLFPVTGQPLYLIGSPWHERATIRLGDAELCISAPGTSEAAMYVQSARFNGQALDRAYLTVAEAHHGGRLELTMGTTPSAWARRTRPPSFPV